ncbi:MAG TPA: type II secretion system protein GspM [Woeseiaceae bacterium]|nr:type II secretion system protein GspM [Woeseiaceae bacterium]
MKEWFESLEGRERLFVATAGVVLALAVFYLAVWLPLDRGQESAASGVQAWRSALADLRSMKGNLQAAGSARGAPAGLNQSLVVVVDNTLRSRDLYSSLQRSSPTPGNGIRLEFENVAFDELVLWLGDLARDYGLQVQSGSFSTSSGGASGRVNATLILER